MNEIILFIIAIIIHEFGHWIAFKIFKYKASIKIKWYGIVVGEEIWLDVTIKQAYFILSLGIILGFIPLLIGTNNKLIYLTYFLLCSADLTNLISLSETKKKDINLTLLEFNKKQIRDWENSKQASQVE